MSDSGRTLPATSSTLLRPYKRTPPNFISGRTLPGLFGGQFARVAWCIMGQKGGERERQKVPGNPPGARWAFDDGDPGGFTACIRHDLGSGGSPGQVWEDALRAGAPRGSTHQAGQRQRSARVVGRLSCPCCIMRLKHRGKMPALSSTKTGLPKDAETPKPSDLFLRTHRTNNTAADFPFRGSLWRVAA